MSNVWVKITSMSNISMHTNEDTGISVEEWTTMSESEKQGVISEIVWEDIEAYAVTEEDEYLD